MQQAVRSNRLNLAIVLSTIFAGLLLGYLSAMPNDPTLFVSGSLVILIGSAIWSAKAERDCFNPLTLLIVLGLVRYTVPWVLLATSEPPHTIARMYLSPANWQMGHALAMLGLVSVVLGWHTNPKRLAHVVKRALEQIGYRMTSQIVITWGWAVFVLGMVGWGVFVVSNAGSVSEVISSGEFRSTAIEEGTGAFFYVAMASIAGSTLLTCYLLLKHRRFGVLPFLPVVVNGAAFFVLGGRARSFTPIACALLIGWYVVLNRQLDQKWILRVSALVFFLIVFSYAGQTYRGKGFAALSNLFSLSNIAAYTQYAAWIEFGQLHALAGAAKVEPGLLQGRSFSSALGKIRQWLGLPGRSSGVLIAQQILGVRDTKFGFHPSFIGDCYLNYGFLGLVLLGIVFGALLRSVYRVGVQMLGSPLGLSFCSIFMVYSVRIYFESVAKTFEMMVVLFFLVGGLFIARLFRRDVGFA